MIRAFLAAFCLVNFAFAGLDLGIIKELFTNPKFDKKSYFKGEMSQRLNDNFYSKAYDVVAILDLKNSGEFDVARVSLEPKNSKNYPLDIYVFNKDDGIYALRSLAMTGVIKELILGYEKGEIKGDVDIENLRLILARDSELSKFGRENADKFEQIFEIYNSNLADKDKQIEQNLKSIHLSSVVVEGDVFTLIIGGMLDNVVGFLRVESDEKLPKMTPGYFIMIEKIAPKWYLFKTT